MGQAVERVKKGFSETRTVILGAQILLGFQYQAIFQKGFDRLPESSRLSAPAVFALLAFAMGLMIAPTALHRIGAGGRATARLGRWLDGMLLLSLIPFASAMALEIATAVQVQLGAGPAAWIGAGAAAVSLGAWFGPGLIGRGDARAPGKVEDEEMSLKDRISEVMEQSRIVLPGVQALLGFQLAAYLSDGFRSLPEASKAAHTAALLLLLLAMILLMACAPFHRIAARGEPSEAVDRAGTLFVLTAMIPLALGIAADFYVLLQKVTGSNGLGLAGAGAVVLACGCLWLGLPLAFRGKP